MEWTHNMAERFTPVAGAIFRYNNRQRRAAMPEHTSALVQAHLHTIAQLLRSADHVGPEAQQLLADLVDELGKALASAEVPNEEIAHLTESATLLAKAVQEENAPGVLQKAESRLESAVVAIESKAPALASLTRRLAEMLSNLGI
jgi:GTP1/Obg family GTP-binding protein